MSDFAIGFPNGPAHGGNVGPIGLAFLPAGNLFVLDPDNGGLYKFSPSGGVAATPINA